MWSWKQSLVSIPNCRWGSTFGGKQCSAANCLSPQYPDVAYLSVFMPNAHFLSCAASYIWCRVIPAPLIVLMNRQCQDRHSKRIIWISFRLISTPVCHFFLKLIPVTSRIRRWSLEYWAVGQEYDWSRFDVCVNHVAKSTLLLLLQYQLEQRHF